ncbi:hypothetical protein [Desulfobacula sp.]|uniref:hypothetical protein n=1 Tax=Desulfobacula sp. TaxID=2593537 RepID=UPI002616AA1F|nr:hypothetical protein [Desulfobacula sp.]
MGLNIKQTQYALGWNSLCLLLVTEISDKDKTATFVGLASTIAWITLAFFCICNLILIFVLPISKTVDTNM